MTADQITRIVDNALNELKAMDIRVLDVSRLTTITDTMIIASGTSDRQVRALADNVIKRAKENGLRPLGLEGEKEAEWVLVDLGDVIVHIMRPAARAYYQLEKLWASEHQQASTTV
ncbi:MAG: ribosome silencing factor [Gammaproteobacteria bacterium]|jgi:ribosome-associated protein